MRFTFCFFFFKQKTAYEMRISDWSSDVCSSDLPTRTRSTPCSRAFRQGPYRERPRCAPARSSRNWSRKRGGPMPGASAISGRTAIWIAASCCAPPCSRTGRSEEHTSELQSLMRISYAVFCLKTKATHEHTTHHIPLAINNTEHKIYH